jgi:hypothetical protein
MFHHLQVYLRKDRDIPLCLSKSPSTLAQGDSRKLRFATDETTTPGYPTPLIRIDPRTDNSSPMAQDMRGHSWRSFAAAHLAPIKDYLVAPRGDHQATPQDHHHSFHHPLTSEIGCDDGEAKKQSWTQFASRKFARRSYSDPDGVTSTERIVLLPGWASRRYHAGPELSNRTGTSRQPSVSKGTDAHCSQVPRMTSRCLSLGMSSSTRPQMHYHVPNERY